MSAIRLLCALILKPALDDLLAGFEAETGRACDVEYGSAGAIDARIASGAAFDLAALQSRRLAGQADAGRIAAGGIKVLGHSGVALAVAAGAPHPEVASADDLRRAIRAAESIVYPDPALGHACGIHFQKVLRQLDLADEVASKAKLAPASFAEFVAGDSAALAVMQPMEILAAPGYEAAAWLPAELQDDEAFTWAAGIATGTAQPAEAARLLEFLTAPASRSVFEAKGLRPPAG